MNSSCDGFRFRNSMADAVAGRGMGGGGCAMADAVAGRGMGGGGCDMADAVSGRGMGGGGCLAGRFWESLPSWEIDVTSERFTASPTFCLDNSFAGRFVVPSSPFRCTDSSADRFRESLLSLEVTSERFTGSPPFCHANCSISFC